MWLFPGTTVTVSRLGRAQVLKQPIEALLHQELNLKNSARVEEIDEGYKVVLMPQ